MFYSRTSLGSVKEHLSVFPFFVLVGRCVQLSNLTSTINGSDTMAAKKTKSTLTPTQVRIAQLQGEVAHHMKRLTSEDWRNLTDTPENRARVECMVKGASAQYGPRGSADKNGDVRDFDILRLMYAPRAESLDFDVDDFLDDGEEYQGETHLAILCSWPSFKLVVRRIYKGHEGFDKETNKPRKLEPAAHLKRLRRLLRVLRHVETFSCWRDEGVNLETGDTFLFKWPREEAEFPFHFFEFKTTSRAYDAEDFNAFGLRFRARPVDEVDESYGPDDTVHPADAKGRTAKKRNLDAKKLGNFID